MADRDWDLSAVVRSWVPTAAYPATASATGGQGPNPSACLATLTFHEEEELGRESFLFGFPNLTEPRNSGFNELQQLYIPFLPRAAADNPSPSVLGASLVSPAPVCVPRRVAQAPDSHSRSVLQQQALHVNHQYNLTPAVQPPQTPRTRKRKSQQKKNVCHVTAENLSSDLWAWRKYGQKPIKGSPYPRNYYRCSSSKGCAARKQVERSNTDPNMFIVTYTGEHTHPRPTHRNSLAGSTRNKFTGALQKAQAASHADDPGSMPTSLSPTTPLTAPIDEDGVIGRDNSVVEGATRSENGEEGEIGDDDMVASEYEADLDGEDLLIPNIANNISEDMFMGFHGVNNNVPNSSYGIRQGSGSGDY
ncbi:hypothetical protein CDL15_Pgr023006 [Punica granatum]|uniref:WRKY domain-containing protein n=1 Tax=Punica granatum TaxID=22663 RepID=A0A218X3U4_PUNGR|nr:hypothetical protein CDL15_Pgr023006 [Punica granatum]